MIITKCDRCHNEMETPAYAKMMFPLIFPSPNKPQNIPKYMIIRSEPNEGQDNLNLCPDCESKLTRFLNGEFLYQDYEA